jgi:ferredoxin-NADP reductase
VTHRLLLRVRSVKRETPSSRIIRLSLDGSLFPYRAGQSAWLSGEAAAERRPYSIASSPEETRETGAIDFLIKVDPKTGAAGPHLPALGRGAKIAVQGPLGSFVFPESPAERDFLFVAGGTGIAPLRSMIQHVLRAGGAGRIGLLYSARSPEDFAYARELRWLARDQRVEVRLTVTREARPAWKGERGRIEEQRLAGMLHSRETLCFVCGPRSMVDDVPRLLQQLGVRRDRIRIEEW